MGKELYCDLCRATIAIEAGLKPVLIGETKICEVCLTCASRLEQGLKKQIADSETAVIMAKKAAQLSPNQPEPVKDKNPSVLYKGKASQDLPKGGEHDRA